MGLTIAYVEGLGKTLFGRKHFLGCFPADIHPSVKGKKVFSVIFNLSKHDEDGSHYIALFANEQEMYFFDSMGDRCVTKDILNFIKKEKGNRRFKENLKQVQHCDSTFCGYFCLGFILSQQLGISSKHFLNFFENKDLILNDKIIVHFIQFVLKNKLY